LDRPLRVRQGARKRSVHLSGQGRLLDRPLRGRHLHNEIRVQCHDRSMHRLTLRMQKVCPISAPRLRQLDRPLRAPLSAPAQRPSRPGLPQLDRPLRVRQGARKRSVHLSGQGRLLDRPLRGRHLHNEIRVQCPDRSMPRPTLRTQKVCPVIAPRLPQLDRPLRGHDVTGRKRSVLLSHRTQKVCPVIAPRLPQLDRPLRGHDVTDPAI
jgi:hypothetical protein